MTKTKHLSIKMSEELFNSIQELSIKNNVSMSELVRTFIIMYNEENSSSYSIFKKNLLSYKLELLHNHKNNLDKELSEIENQIEEVMSELKII